MKTISAQGLAVAALLSVACAGGAGGAAPTGGDAADPPDGQPQETGEDSGTDSAASGTWDSVYVSPQGDDGASGTPNAPLKTIAAALNAAATAHKSVRLCSPAVFNEAVTITAAVDLRGGVDCATGNDSPDRATIAPNKGIPLTIRGATSTVTIARIAMKAADALDPSASSIAALVVNSDNVSFEQVSFEAGNGGDGASAPAPAGAEGPAPAGGAGGSLFPAVCRDNSGPCNWVGEGGWRNIPGACGIGGAGGAGGSYASRTPQPGASGLPQGYGGAPGLTLHISGDPGQPGRDGDIGADGASAVAGVGSVTADGYVASNSGGDGRLGTPGGGGGGGAGAYFEDLPCGDIAYPEFYIGGGGAQGGFGGCGGAGAKGASAGGASIALMTIHSHVSIHSAVLTAGAGGAGGDGTAGAPGQPGGPGGRGGSSSYTSDGLLPCQQKAPPVGQGGSGGPGGNGGKGGAGGAAGGGPSFALVAKDIAPTTDAVTYNLGHGGKGGRAVRGPDAADGMSAQTFLVNIADGGAP